MARGRAPCGELEARIGYAFRDPGRLSTALIHKSYANEHPGEGLTSNERMEFLGDSVLGLAISHLLMEAYAEEPEGVLSRWRAALVNERTLAQKARDLDLGRYLVLGKGEERTQGREKDSLLADAMEAVLAAVYLDGGFQQAFEVIRTLFHEDVTLRPWAPAAEDFKTRLQEHTQSSLRVTPRYILLGEEGPDHDKTFRVALDLGEGLVSVGKGRSKKEAEQRAAREMLERLSGPVGED